MRLGRRGLFLLGGSFLRVLARGLGGFLGVGRHDDELGVWMWMWMFDVCKVMWKLIV